MALEKLGEKLRESLQRLFKATHIDAKLIDNITADIKKSLIAADVNIELANKITEIIKRRALAEKSSKLLTAREHTINIVYDELVKFLGDEAGKLEIEKKPTKIALQGLFGSGKCVHPESLIPLADGRVLTAEQLHSELSIGCEKEIDGDAEISDIADTNILVPSFNPQTLKIENKRLTHLWKLRGKELLQVYLDNGNDFTVKVTPEHPFFVLRAGEVQQIRAEELTEDDFVAVPQFYQASGLSPDLLPELRALNLDIKLEAPLKFSEPIKDLHKTLTFKRNYCRLTADLKRQVAPLFLVPDDRILPNLSVKVRQSVKFVNFPRYLTAELAEFAGYVFGDGHIDKNYIQIVNEDREIIERVRFLSKTLFGLEPTIKRDMRRKAIYDIRLNSVTLVNLFNKVFGIPIGKKGKALTIPKQIFQSDLETIRQFLKAYFDCDSSAAKDHRDIELVTESKIAAQGVKLLLLRFGIVSSLSKKAINGVYYWRLRISARYAEAYAEKIGFRVAHKSERAMLYHNIGVMQGCGKQDMIPLSRVLEETRLALGFSIGEIQKHINSYGNYERKGLISRESLFKLCKVYKETKIGVIAKVLSSIHKSEDIRNKFSRGAVNGSIHQFINYGFIEKQNNMLQLTQEGLALLSCSNQFEKLAYLNIIADSNVCWLRVGRLETCAAPEYVYDFTVEDNHSFIADGIVVHNTTTAGKLAKYYKKKGLKVALLQTDTWRPAAFEQLKQLAEKINVPFYGIKEEKDPIKIIKKFEPDFDKFNVVILDTAGRDALNTELIREIKAIKEAFRPDESLLVLSGDIGQTAFKQADTFKEAVGISGVIITKLDGTAKGGGALSACSATGAKVKFIGTGEHIEDLEEYKPKNFVSRLLGMGDLETLLKRAEEVMDKDTAEELGKKFLKAEFTLTDVYKQMESVKKMGPLSQVIGMIPGMANAIPKELLEIQEDKMKNWKYIIDSCTPVERDNPDIIKTSRISRIAKGSGKSEQEVRDLIKQYNQMKKVMKQVGNPKQLKKLEKLMNMRGLKGGLPGI